MNKKLVVSLAVIITILAIMAAFAVGIFAGGYSAAPIASNYLAGAWVYSGGDECNTTQGWSSWNTSLSSAYGELIITENGSGIYGAATKTFTVDLDNTPYLIMKVNKTVPRWSLNVAINGIQKSIHFDNTKDCSGVLAYDLTGLFNLRGVQSIDVIPYPTMDSSVVKIDYIRFGTKLSSITTNINTQKEANLVYYDTDSANPLFNIVNQPNHGIVTILNPNTGSFRYTPASNFSGVDSFSWNVLVDGSYSNVATANITVLPGSTTMPTHSVPIASNYVTDAYVYEGGDECNTTQGWSASNTAISSSSGELVITENGPSVYGSASKTFAVDLEKTPNLVIRTTNTLPRWSVNVVINGIAKSIYYDNTKDCAGILACDLKGSFNLSGTQSVTVFIFPTMDHGSVSVDYVRFGLKLPVINTHINTQKDANLVCYDSDYANPQFNIVSQPVHGTVTILNPNTGSFRYTPAYNYSGSDSFMWNVLVGGAYSNTATVNINVLSGTDTPIPTPIPVLNPNPYEYYKIIAKHSGLALTTTGQDCSIITQTAFRGLDTQLWKFEPTDNGYYKLVSKKSGRCVIVEGGWKGDGVRLIEYIYQGGYHQQWKLESVGGGYIVPKVRSTDKAMDVSGGSLLEGAYIQQWDYLGFDNQKWRIESL